MAQVAQFKIRPHTYRIDNIIIDEYGDKIGAIGVAVYNVLARHADRQTGVSFPSIRLICKKLKLGRSTVKKYLRILLNHDLISITSRYTEEGDLTSNSYMILDPAPEQMARRRLQRDRLISGYYASPAPETGGSPADRPPSPTATDPRSPADHEQLSLNKDIRTSVPPSRAADRQLTCPHPVEELVFLSEGICICNHCYGCLDGERRLIDDDAPPERVRAA
jgi:hypothetical protein